MIVSVSRRTDIPAFYMDWFIQRLREGYVLAQNPMNSRQIRRIQLAPEETQIVFWTKDAAPMLQTLSALERYTYYIHFTLTPYSRDIEPGLPFHSSRVRTFLSLAEKIGPEKIIWRYDPVILNSQMTPDWHLEQFTRLTAQLSGGFSRCIISFLDMYRCMRKRSSVLGLLPPSSEEKRQIAGQFADIARRSGFQLYACAEEDVRDLLPASACIDAELLSEIAGHPITSRRDQNQRPLCCCAGSTDIGVYNSCPHGCLYCYATHSYTITEKNRNRYNLSAPLLLGSPAD